MISFWERESLLHFDIIIIGSGIVGLQTAIQLKERRPDRSVLILERGLLPSGASTRNAGFAATGSLSEMIDDRNSLSEEQIFDLFKMRKQGLDFIRNQFGDAAIGYVAEGSHEMLTKKEEFVLDEIEHFNKLLKELNPQAVYENKTNIMSEFGFQPEAYTYCISNSTEGALHSGKLLASLIKRAISLGVEIKTGADVRQIVPQSNQVLVQVNSSFDDSTLDFRAEQLILCTNAFTKQFLPDLELQPGRGQVLVTKPIPNLKVKGIYHFDKGYYYFRNVGARVLFGGGRNLDFKGENTTEMVLNPTIQNHLVEILETIILPRQHFEIDMQWAGIMAFGKTKEPIVAQFEDRIFGGFRLGGIGVALGSSVAVQLANLVQ